VVIIDSSAILYQQVFINSPEAINENPGLFIHTFLERVIFFSKRFGASFYSPLILAIDSKNTWRKEIYPEYKGGRVKNEAYDWVKIFSAYGDMLEYLDRCTDFIVVKVDRTEADDIIAVLVRENEKEGKDAFIISHDKDLKQLVTNRTHYYKIGFGGSGDFVAIDDKEYLINNHCLLGDKIDNIDQVEKGVGKVTVAKILSEGSEGLSNYLDTDASRREKYEFNRTLIDLDRIPLDIQESVKEVYNTKKGKFNYDQIELMSLMWKYDLRKHLTNIKDFKVARVKTTTDFVDAYLNKNKEIVSKTKHENKFYSLDDLDF